MRFALFSLGDRAYGEQFCAAGRKLAVRLLQLGAVLLCEPGYGDDGTPQGGVFADLDQWIQNTLFSTLETMGHLLPSKEGAPQTSSSLLPTDRYAVTVKEPLLSTNGETEEWMQPAYQDSYRTFFESVAPLTAYKYDLDSSLRIDKNRTEGIGLLFARVAENRRITAEDWEQNTRHIRLQVSLSLDHSIKQENYYRVPANWSVQALPYKAGDVVSILPINDSTEVQRFIDLMPPSIQTMADHNIFINDLLYTSKGASHIEGGVCWPRHCTLRGWLTYCADIHTLPEREDLRALSYYCSLEHPLGKDQRDKLRSLSETEAAALYADYVLRNKRCWVDVLYDFDSLRDPGSKLTLQVLLTMLSPMRPREFSIASSPTRNWMLQRAGEGKGPARGFDVELCVAVVEGTTPLGRSFHGLCSNYLSRLIPGQSLVKMWIRSGSFQGLSLNVSPQLTEVAVNRRMTTPLLCIGAGTGVAPLRGLILEREAVFQQASKDGAILSSQGDTSMEGKVVAIQSQADNILLFGCRKAKADFYYKDEWSALEKKGRCRLLTAFSQDQWHKIYVQQVLKKMDQDENLIFKHVLEENGAIFIAGGPKMARAVKDEIVESLSKGLGGDCRKAKVLLASMQRQGRFSIEAWS